MQKLIPTAVADRFDYCLESQGALTRFLSMTRTPNSMSPVLTETCGLREITGTMNSVMQGVTSCWLRVP